jgi:uncharacterized membrane protein YdbT with pleckstrin-like domain
MTLPFVRNILASPVRTIQRTIKAVIVQFLVVDLIYWSKLDLSIEYVFVSVVIFQMAANYR